MDAIATQPIWVDEAPELADLCARWSQQAAIAIDTEFMRSHTFYPHAGLIQVGDGKGCYLIDPLAIDDLSPLTRLLQDPAVTKVIHSCSEDLETFRFLLGVVPTPLFDTQLAAAFANVGFSLGYAKLVKELLGIELDKGETRSDWMQRPLSQAQLHYAALDVAYLLVVYGKLLIQLKSLNRLHWVQEECAALVSKAEAPESWEMAYTKVKLAWKLYPDQLAILKPLCQWRERLARQLDIPRNRLMKEGAAWEIARRKPNSLRALSAVDGIGKRTLREYAAELLSMVEQAAALPPEQLPERLPRPLTPAQGDILKQFKACAAQVAEQMAIAPEILTRKKDLEQLTRSVIAGQVQLPEGLCGWRYPVIGQPLEKLAKTMTQAGDNHD